MSGYVDYGGNPASSRSAASLRYDRPGLLGKLARLPWGLIALIAAMALVGTAMLYSTTFHKPGMSGVPLKHVMRFAISFIIMIALALTPISVWLRGAFIAYLATLILLIITELAGISGGGAQRWLVIGPLVVQPSEFMKLTLTLALARYYQQFMQTDKQRLLIHIGALMIIALPAGLIVIQPDLGTTLALVASGGVIIFLAGLGWRIIISSILAGLAAVPAAYWFVLKPYQRERVDTFLALLLGRDTNLNKEAYQQVQGQIAIGSGGWDGKGFMQGIQSQQDFVPEQHTDFILTVIAEEFGFIGTAGLLILWAIILGWAFSLAMKSNSLFGRLAGTGAVATVAFYIVFNAGMVLGLLPVVGMPMPLVSYGGTAMLTTMACFGLVLSVHLHSGDKPDARGVL